MDKKKIKNKSNINNNSKKSKKFTFIKKVPKKKIPTILNPIPSTITYRAIPLRKLNIFTIVNITQLYSLIPSIPLKLLIILLFNNYRLITNSIKSTKIKRSYYSRRKFRKTKFRIIKKNYAIKSFTFHRFAKWARRKKFIVRPLRRKRFLRKLFFNRKKSRTKNLKSNTLLILNNKNPYFSLLPTSKNSLRLVGETRLRYRFDSTPYRIWKVNNNDIKSSLRISSRKIYYKKPLSLYKTKRLKFKNFNKLNKLVNKLELRLKKKRIYRYKKLLNFISVRNVITFIRFRKINRYKKIIKLNRFIRFKRLRKDKGSKTWSFRRHTKLFKTRENKIFKHSFLKALLKSAKPYSISTRKKLHMRKIASNSLKYSNKKLKTYNLNKVLNRRKKNITLLRKNIFTSLLKTVRFTTTNIKLPNIFNYKIKLKLNNTNFTVLNSFTIKRPYRFKYNFSYTLPSFNEKENYNINKIYLNNKIVKSNSVRYNYLSTKKFSSFTFGNFTLLMLSKSVKFASTVIRTKYRKRYKFFSFVQRNELYKAIFQHKRHKISVSVLHRLTKRLSTQIVSHSNVFTKLKGFIDTIDIFKNNTIFESLKLNFPYESVGNSRSNLRSFNRRKEIMVPRMKFRRGYQTLWRYLRLTLQDVMGLKFQYQHRLTKHLVRYYRTCHKVSLVANELELGKVLIYSQLLPDMSTVKFFSDANLIFLNERNTFNTKIVVNKNDLISLQVSNWFYIYNRWLENWTINRVKQFKRLVYRKGMAYRHKLMKNRKTKSQHIPTWVEKVRYDSIDVRPYIEVDYFTLSAFIIYDPFFTFYNKPDGLLDGRGNIFKLYNWKYII